MIRSRLKCLLIVAVCTVLVFVAFIGSSTWYRSSDNQQTESEYVIKLMSSGDQLGRAIYNPVHFDQVKELQAHGGDKVNVEYFTKAENKPKNEHIQPVSKDRISVHTHTKEQPEATTENGIFGILDELQDVNNKSPAATKKQQVHILIYTKRRCGSSFLGQIFNNNPDVFFQFEPLKLLETYMNYSKLQEHASDLLKNIFKCDLKSAYPLVNFYNKEKLHRWSSKLLISPPFCNLQNLTRYSISKCPAIQQREFLETCHQSKHIVIKIIRVINLRSLAPLLMDPTLNIKIVHLVRDPRAIYTSRVQTEGLTYDFDHRQETEIGKLCKGMIESHQVSQERHQWLRNKYTLVRYEDLARNPMQTAEKLYKDIGLGQLPEAVKSWININSNVDPGSVDRYSTQRNSSAIVQAWRGKLPFNVSEQIENVKVCAEVLDTFGYGRPKSKKELTDMTLSLVRSIPTV
ncbi:carbohydrate sulfotransferase 1-like [Ptychodera flava]|uniref:carbohydrate sulfotransferase 1-like n=1 Tax=Ptychodera flava TaxID=63121 RepID=UPI003969EFE9